ncbi:rare lipoprotein A [Hyphomicrobium nitrativorans NL23]|uniref:Rare lipoprotein A n=1 Tax=Hyphomicrobium nitrativorans NL23 TaxID=1029756 RepID=V5SDH7_9HYPH|nr:septal ring lytic transglycosylase RlpA family protein [Hyphomicrobium nitrativorans]AHB48921.1 rare lipoprotein A [Hyphomicrobium nitrativorans NL23]
MTTHAPWRAFFAVAALAGAAFVTYADTAAAKTPGKTYCYNKVCHRVKTLDEMEKLVGHEEVLVSSYYDDCKVDKFNPCTRLSSGEEHRPDLPDNAASPVYPNGTILLLEKNGTKLLVRVNNSGPYRKGRMLDVSRAAAEELGFKKKGVAKIKVTVISGPIR